MPLTIYAQSNLVKHVFLGTQYVQPTSYTVGLFSTSPSQTSNGVELSGGGYARATATFDVPSDQPQDPLTYTTNILDIVFPKATANWAPAVAYGVFDQLGNLLVYNPMAQTLNVANGEQWMIPARSLEIDWSL